MIFFRDLFFLFQPENLTYPPLLQGKIKNLDLHRKIAPPCHQPVLTVCMSVVVDASNEKFRVIFPKLFWANCELCQWLGFLIEKILWKHFQTTKMNVCIFFLKEYRGIIRQSVNHPLSCSPILKCGFKRITRESQKKYKSFSFSKIFRSLRSY